MSAEGKSEAAGVDTSSSSNSSGGGDDAAPRVALPEDSVLVDADGRMLLYGDPAHLTTVERGAKFLPKDLYAAVVQYLPIVCVDVIVRRRSDKHMLLVQRDNEPLKGVWWFPGGRVYKGESFIVAAKRKVKEETGLDTVEHGVLGMLGTMFSTSAWDNAEFHGTHTVNIVVSVWTDAEQVTLDHQSAAFRWDPPVATAEHDPYVHEGLRMLAEYEAKRG